MVWRKENIFFKLFLCYSSVCYYNGAEWYKQFLQVGQLAQGLILLDFALCLLSTSLSSVFMVLYMLKNVLVTFFTLPLSELNLVALELVD